MTARGAGEDHDADDAADVLDLAVARLEWVRDWHCRPDQAQRDAIAWHEHECQEAASALARCRALDGAAERAS